MSKMRRSYLKALVILAASSTVAATELGQGYAGPVLTPNSLDFGNVLVGTASASQTVSVAAPTTEGFPALSIVSITVPPNYVRTGGSCPTSGAASNPCTVNLAFAPSAVGAAPGTMVVSASINGGIAGSSNAALSGVGVPGQSVAAPSLGAFGLGLLLAALMATGFHFVRKR